MKGIRKTGLRYAGMASVCVMAGFSACRFSSDSATEKPLSARVTWDGHAAEAYSADSARDSAAAGESAFASKRRHHFRFSPDSLRLDLEEFDQAYQAFGRFQEHAGVEAMSDGFFRTGDKLVFLAGEYVGTLHASGTGLIPAHFLKDKLAIEDASNRASGLPPEFGAFPLLGRIAHSERVNAGNFLGRNWKGPVFSAQYRCHQDTATAFRAFVQSEEVKSWPADWVGHEDSLDWGREIRFTGVDEFRRPLIFWFFSGGVMGFEGCWDPVLAGEYAEKMEKTRVLWPKP